LAGVPVACAGDQGARGRLHAGRFMPVGFMPVGFMPVGFTSA
jgi:hypothetical protein